MIDREKSKQALGFISNLTHVEGSQFAGKPFHLFMWQKRIIHKLFGTVKEDGYRQYRTCYIEIPKKNGKSELGAAIALKLLCADGEIGAEVYSVASDKEQAGIIFRKAAQMVRNSEELSDRLKIIDSQKRIVDYSTNSYYRVLSSDVETKHGFNPHGVIFDELHTQPNRKLWDVLTVGTDAARKQQLVFVMTTAGFDRNSICREVHDYALNVRDGVQGFEDSRFLSKIFGVPDNSNWEDEAEWINANPSIDKIFGIENLRNEYREAKAVPAKENEFRRLRLNQWTEQEVRLIPMDYWNACNTPVDEEGLKGKTCFAGLDLSSTQDVTALELLFPSDNGDGPSILSYFFVPADTIREKSQKDRVPYDVWARQGFITATDGNIVDYDFILAKIKELGSIYDIKEVMYDRWGATKLANDLQNEGITIFPMGQGFASMSAPTKEFLKLVLEKKIRHGGNPVLSWMASNVAAKYDAAANIKVDKSKCQDKVDGIVALIMALDGYIRHGNMLSVYNRRGIVSL